MLPTNNELELDLSSTVPNLSPGLLLRMGERLRIGDLLLGEGDLLLYRGEGDLRLGEGDLRLGEGDLLFGDGEGERLRFGEGEASAFLSSAPFVRFSASLILS